jgi:DNA-binding LacI/PurR family transcriptional regulator
MARTAVDILLRRIADLSAVTINTVVEAALVKRRSARLLD